MRQRALALASVAAVLAALPAAGDWLITRDGTRIETEGPWKEKGSQVIFTLPGGRLSAMRLADVDLEASAAATRSAAAAAAEAPAKTRARPSVRKITNETVSAASGVAEDAAEEEPDETDADDGTEAAEDAAADTEAAVPEGEPVEVGSWSTRDSADGLGLEIVGTLHNTGDQFAAAIRVKARIPGQEEEPPFDAEAFLDHSALAPGATTGFVVRLPETLFLPGDPTFEVSSEGFLVGSPPEPESSSEETDPEAGELEPPP